MGREPDQHGAKRAPVALAERTEQLMLRPPGRLAGSPHGPPALRGQLDKVPAPVGRVGSAAQEPALLELIEERHEIARLDAQRHRQVSLGDRPLRVEVVQDGELRPPQPALAEAPAEPPCGGPRQAEDQEPDAGIEGRVSGFGLWLSGCPGGCLDGLHVPYITYIP